MQSEVVDIKTAMLVADVGTETECLQGRPPVDIV
jgi:hypothetical protein